jgi:hypothetical protein
MHPFRRFAPGFTIYAIHYFTSFFWIGDDVVRIKRIVYGS